MNHLLANDPALPQRDLLVDESLMAEYLSRLVTRYGDYGVKRCERLRTKYRVGASLRVLYEVSGSGRSYRIAARAFPRSRQVAKEFTSAREIHAPELNTIFWVFPDDRKITNLAVLTDIPEPLRHIEGREWRESRIVGHVPEKSVTARCLDAEQKIVAYAKVYAGNEGRSVFDAYHEIHTALKSEVVQLRIPRALSYSEKHRLLLLESVPGVPLSALRPADRERAYLRLGEALKKLHRLTPPSSASSSTRMTPDGLTQAVATIARVRPEVAGLARQLTDKLIAQHDQIFAAEPVLLHGDLHPKNVLMADERLFLLDLDQAATGAAAFDVGGVIAGLYCEACTGLITARQLASLINAFLIGYGHDRESQPSLRWYVAAALLEERALRAITRIRFGGLEKLPQILTTAETVLDGGIYAH